MARHQWLDEQVQHTRTTYCLYFDRFIMDGTNKACEKRRADEVNPRLRNSALSSRKDNLNQPNEFLDLGAVRLSYNFDCTHVIPALPSRLDSANEI